MYNYKTTFSHDFMLAYPFGEAAIRDTYQRAFAEWKDNLEYITELSIVLNHLAWHFADTDESASRLFARLWQDCHGWCMLNLRGEDLAYYLETTD